MLGSAEKNLFDFLEEITDPTSYYDGYGDYEDYGQEYADERAEVSQ